MRAMSRFSASSVSTPGGVGASAVLASPGRSSCRRPHEGRGAGARGAPSRIREPRRNRGQLLGAAVFAALGTAFGAETAWEAEPAKAPAGLWAGNPAGSAAAPGAFVPGNAFALDARGLGARGDGVSDDTAALQAALDRAGASGGRVILPPGKYLVAGSLRVPPGVLLEGALDSPVWSEPLRGSIVLATGGRDREDGPALFELGHSSAVRGLTVFYPEQKPGDVRPYPWTFHLRDHDNTVENVTLINSFNGIQVGPEPNVRHRIRSVAGTVLRRGILVDSCTDIGRIENVQFHCHWWSAKDVGGDWQLVYDYMTKHCEAFIFGRTDWEYVANTFVFPVNVGYRFIRTKSGAANGQFVGIGADAAERCVVVEEIQYMGLLVTNGQFVAFAGEDPIELVIEKTCRGSVRLVNCAFWGPAKQNVVAHGQSFVSLSDCYLSSDRKDGTRALIEADGGRLQVRGCSFGIGDRHIALRKGIEHAIISENNGWKGVEIEVDPEVAARAVVRDNEPVGR